MRVTGQRPCTRACMERRCCVVGEEWLFRAAKMSRERERPLGRARCSLGLKPGNLKVYLTRP
jgi:hypothetical protein